jgi:DNA-directed RNA polymerase subunit RPC12/RpoP
MQHKKLMAISYVEQEQLHCPSCGAEFTADIWLVLDAQEHPEHVAALLRHELNTVACPACGFRGPAGAPLLFHDAVARSVIFAPAPGLAEHEWREQARELHALLVGSIPEEQRRPYLADVDIAQDIDGVAHRLERRARRRGDPAPAAAPLPAAEPAPLLLAVQALLAAETEERLAAVFAEYPLLRNPSTDLALRQLADVATEQREFAVAESLSQVRAMLRQMLAVEPQLGAEAPIAPATVPELVLHELLQTQTNEDLHAVVARHPLLLHPEVNGLLAMSVDLALEEGNERLALALEQRRAALEELRSQPLAEDGPAVTMDEAIEALLLAESEDEMVATIRRYPLLLEDVASQTLDLFAAEAQASGDDEIASDALMRREVLKRVKNLEPRTFQL